ncbi:hypothetical protein DFJ74DRAFT_676004 [Hyaloraphidium curvatum]|nr:hypothetical protein DFJ74DRAFT_676004 [Hyaloraphidium curvatum]
MTPANEPPAPFPPRTAMRPAMPTLARSLPALLLALLAAPLASAQSSFQLSFNQTTVAGRTVCRETSSMSAVSIQTSEAWDCPGPCPFAQLSQSADWRWTGTTNTSGLLVRATSDNVTCPEVLKKGTCVQSEVDQCRYLGVKYETYSFQDGPTPDRSETISCYGGEPGVCTWYYDADCTQIVPPGVAANRTVANCTVALPTTPQQAWSGWCLAAYQVLYEGATPNCSATSASSIATATTLVTSIVPTVSSVPLTATSAPTTATGTTTASSTSAAATTPLSSIASPTAVSSTASATAVSTSVAPTSTSAAPTSTSRPSSGRRESGSAGWAVALAGEIV